MLVMAPPQDILVTSDNPLLIDFYGKSVAHTRLNINNLRLGVLVNWDPGIDKDLFVYGIGDVFEQE